MTKPIVKIVDTSTGEELEREMTDAEFLEYQANQKAEAQRIAEAEAKAAAKTALLERLGITEAEAKLLLA